MRSYEQERLSMADQAFLRMEGPHIHAHIASVQIFDARPLRTRHGGIDFEAIRRAHRAALPQLPRYTQVLGYVPLLNQPYWRPAPHVDLDFHVRHVALPRPGTTEQLKRIVGHVASRPLDRSRPLWESWVIEGLEDDRFAIVHKVHHCMTDGVGGVGMLEILLTPEPRDPADAVGAPSGAAPSRPVPGVVLHETLHRVRATFGAARTLASSLLRGDTSMSSIGHQGAALWTSFGAALGPAPRTHFNRPIGADRRYEWLSMDLGEIRALAREHDASVNDIVLAVASGAFRRYLADRGADLRRLPFRVLAPVSLRGAGESANRGNRVSGWIVELPLAEEDPRARIGAIRTRTRALKRAHELLGKQLLEGVTNCTLWFLSAAAQSTLPVLPFNSIVTNVPGPRTPLHLLHSRLLEIYPHIPLVHGMGIGLALVSYDGKLHWGVTADPAVAPDLHRFVDMLREARSELSRASAISPGASRRRAVASTRRSGMRASTRQPIEAT